MWFNKRRIKWVRARYENKNLKEVADALTDILYVTYGAGYAYGIDLDKCFKEVQRANMSKLGRDGKPIYNEKGKVMKGPNYLEPNLKQFVEWKTEEYKWLFILQKKNFRIENPKLFKN